MFNMPFIMFNYWGKEQTDGYFGIYGHYNPHYKILKIKISWYFGSFNWFIQFKRKNIMNRY